MTIIIYCDLDKLKEFDPTETFKKITKVNWCETQKEIMDTDNGKWWLDPLSIDTKEIIRGADFRNKKAGLTLFIAEPLSSIQEY